MKRPEWFLKLDKALRLVVAVILLLFAWEAATSSQPQAAEWRKVSPALFLLPCWMLLWFPLQWLEGRFGTRWWIYLFRPLVTLLAFIGATLWPF